MLCLIWESQFKRDFKNAKKRGKKMEKLAHVILELQHNRQLPPKNKNHKLKGNYIDFCECHIEPDWLLIYQITPTEWDPVLTRIPFRFILNISRS